MKSCGLTRLELAHPDFPRRRGNLLGAIAYAMHSQMNAAMIATTRKPHDETDLKQPTVAKAFGWL